MAHNLRIAYLAGYGTVDQIHDMDRQISHRYTYTSGLPTFEDFTHLFAGLSGTSTMIGVAEIIT